jgi:hypothetical protein
MVSFNVGFGVYPTGMPRDEDEEDGGCVIVVVVVVVMSGSLVEFRLDVEELLS